MVPVPPVLQEILSQLSYFFSSILHFLALIYAIFTCVDPNPDPYLEYRSGATKFLNPGTGTSTGTYLIWIRDLEPQHWF